MGQPNLRLPDVLSIRSNSSPGRAKAKAKLSPNGIEPRRALLAAVLMVSVTVAGNDVIWDGENEHAAPVGRPVQVKEAATGGVPWITVTLSDTMTLPPALTETPEGLMVNPSWGSVTFSGCAPALPEYVASPE